MASSLLEQNPWLRDPAKREAALRISAASSSAVEGIYKPFADKADAQRAEQTRRVRRTTALKEASKGA
jgi:hypothetical protein